MLSDLKLPNLLTFDEEYKILLDDLIKYCSIITILNFLFFVSKPKTQFWNQFYIDSISYIIVSLCFYHLIVKKVVKFS